MMFFSKSEDPPATAVEKLKYFLSTHWRGLVVIVVPIAASFIIFMQMPVKGYQWCAYTLLVMAGYWVSECMPLPVTSFLPLIIFPITGVMNCIDTCKCYLNDTVIVFLGSLLLASSIEQSGLHIRLALCAIRTIGYSHYKLLLAMGSVTMFVSMWLTNTAATTMVVPINFALLKVFEDQKLLNIYENMGDTQVAGPFTVVYFCSATFSATIGGIGTLIGTGTNLVFKGLMDDNFPTAPEYLTFPRYSMFAVPYVILMQASLYFSLIVTYLGFLRPNSEAAKRAAISPEGIKAAKAVVQKNTAELGSLSFWECMVLSLFGFAVALFFSRSPKMFVGWADRIHTYFGIEDSKFIRDSANTLGVILLMLIAPSTLGIFKNFTAKFREDLPKGPIPSVIKFEKMDAVTPYSFMFLLGGGFALSRCAKADKTDLNGRIGDVLARLSTLPNGLIVFVMIVFTISLTNFASNVAVANVVVPIGQTLAKNIGKNPLLYTLACGVSASYCFMLPVGTPGNLVVQSAAKITSGQMIRCGALPTFFIVFITWAALVVWARVIWPDIMANAADLSWSWS